MNTSRQSADPANHLWRRYPAFRFRLISPVEARGARRGDCVATVMDARENAMSVHLPRERTVKDRRRFIGGSDARIIMGEDEGALVRLWREKRGETEPEDLSANLLVQLGSATEDLN